MVGIAKKEISKRPESFKGAAICPFEGFFYVNGDHQPLAPILFQADAHPLCLIVFGGYSSKSNIKKGLK